MNRNFHLTEDEKNFLADRFETPFMVISLNKVQENYLYLKKQLPRVKVFYAMKANSTPEVLLQLANLGSNFDVASPGEMRALNALGISGSRMVYANPVKTLSGIKLAHDLGVDKFTFDDESEIHKLASYAPGAKVLVRVRVENKDAVVNLNEKFGAAPMQALQLLQLAKDNGLIPAGICFHVGSQSLSADAYITALEMCRELFDKAEIQGMHLTALDIGGGLPVPNEKVEAVDVDSMTDILREKLDELFPDTEIWSEPGRFMCGTAVNLVTSVIGTKMRNGQPWYVLDDGLYGSFNGLMFDHWNFKMKMPADKAQEKAVPSTFVGPSCDSIDVVARDLPAPKLEIGDRIMVPNIGAYSTSAATSFNGFPPADTIVYEDNIAVSSDIAVG
ncbi:MAG: type III PLP-dependent enzyme [Selenomonadales bacterium]|nr:type III PLP-dependent enzyme [Selenomonadales bacterium]MEE1361714.1 type III PLP-dependent enzyme [Selenomonadaceae bacterium]